MIQSLMSRGSLFWLAVFVCGRSVGWSQQEPPQQMIVALAEDRDTNYGRMRLFSRNEQGEWQPESGVWRVNFGKNGLAWGLGLHPRQRGKEKVEGDGRTPAGVFRIGKVLGNESALPPGNRGWPYHQKTELDAWPEDENNKYYNRLYSRPKGFKPAWFDKEKFRLSDPTYHWLIVVDHNRRRKSIDDPNVETMAGRGSAIFFHTRRVYTNGKPRPSAGCTTMEREHLVEVIRWLRAGSQAQYVVMSEDDYDDRWRDWNLPNPDMM